MTDAGNANAGAVRRTPRWMLVALFVSLALNLIVVGSVAGAVWRFRTPPPSCLVKTRPLAWPRSRIRA